MLPNPERMEIDHHTIKLIIGLVAISLASLTSFFSGPPPIDSISASYHRGGLPRDIFVGALLAISAFLFAYNGKSPSEMVLSKIAAIAAIGVAIFPCKCGDHDEVIPYVHGLSALVMFVVLAIFCYVFFRRAWAKNTPQAKVRAVIYAACGIIIVIAISILGIDHLLGGAIGSKIDRLTFKGEAAGLFAFGIAWLSASRVLPVITNRTERLSLSPFQPESGTSATT